MKLKAYLKAKGIRQVQALSEINKLIAPDEMSKADMSRYVNGKRRPLFERMKAIHDWSKGEVSLGDWD